MMNVNGITGNARGIIINVTVFGLQQARRRCEERTLRRSN
jgi:hypothetical protein